MRVRSGRGLDMSEMLLKVRNLAIDYYHHDRGWQAAVDGIDLDLAGGEILALAGESGCGKSTLMMALAGLLPGNARIRSGRATLAGQDLLSLSEPAWRELRGRQLVWLPQNPMHAFNPVLRIGRQLVGLLAARRRLSHKQASQALEAGMSSLDVSYDDRLLDRYPHELSGGMRQRLLMALALACQPRVVLADEPCSALDASSQATLLECLRTACKEQGVGVISVTHDLALVAGHGDRVGVMYCGQLVETGKVDAVFQAPRHPYTAALLASHPAASPIGDKPLLAAIPGQPPAAGEDLKGCRFANRCGHQRPRCGIESPELTSAHEDQNWRCHFPLPTAAASQPQADPDQSSSGSTKTGSS